MSGSPKWPFSLRFSHQHPGHTSPLHRTRHVPRSFYSYRFYHPHNIG
jgi:hypothetical protein